MLAPDPITLPITPPTPAPAAPRTLIERQMAKLERLSEIGMEIAEAAGQRARALAEGDPTDTTDAAAAEPGLSFARAARAVRLTIALQSRLVEALAALDRGEALARVGEASRRRNRIQRLVEDAAEAEGCDAEEVERLSSEVWERLDEQDDADLLDAPIEQVVARICRDLGLSPELTVWPVPHPSPGPADVSPPSAPAPDDERPPRAAWADDPLLQREQRENRNEPGTGISERVRQ
ncbi:MAG: hypothetical protein B7Y99_10350 [Caulobacterales bacterium 32-69-10]|nr:MAG: hypothetical protein B7Y99_10350 [Caulobacterales bacterium 32-69-10]